MGKTVTDLARAIISECAASPLCPDGLAQELKEIAHYDGDGTVLTLLPGNVEEYGLFVSADSIEQFLALPEDVWEDEITQLKEAIAQHQAT